MNRTSNIKAAKSAAKCSKVAAQKPQTRKIATKKVQKPSPKAQKKASPVTLAKRFGGGGGNTAEKINEHNADEAYKQKYGLFFSQQNGKDFTQFNSSHYDHNFEHYALAPHQQDHKTRNYLMMAGTKAAYIGLGRSVVHGVIGQLQASADVLAMASVEVELGALEEGTTTTIKWRGKPVFLKHRTPEEIAIARRDDTADMRDKQNDSDRVQKDNWLIVLGVCTHLGCVPIPNAGNHVGGFFCPCHGSHYDASGRIREGPAPLNLEVPGYKFVDDNTVVIG